ncbi:MULTISPECIES: hypothetical protein [Falsihalocynthiibacter]|uniref:hypothetical protein n=1 Tax=Falsihalocynthiibacter TaxID=2854182 RepID=UPI00300376A9
MRNSLSVVSMIALLGLVACQSGVPDSGVGFDDFEGYNYNTAQALQGSPVQAGVISDEDVGSSNISLALEEAVKQTPDLNGAPSQPQASRTGISDEQSFKAVAARETIASDAERLAEQRAQYQVINPTALPSRTSTSSATAVIAFALGTTNSVGESIYARSGRYSQEKYTKACSKYLTSNDAQEAFLQNGGPQKDSKGIDPDGDGFACAWTPAPFRAARRG